jgi:hypothetical protein
MSSTNSTEPANLISGVAPDLCLKADLGPPRSECGVGALMPWCDSLWVVTYLSHTKETGSGTGLYEITPDFKMTKRPESHPGTYTNRMVHFPTNQMIIGPHVVDAEKNVRTIESLLDVRISGTARHLEKHDTHVYMLGMEGEFFELDMQTLETKLLFNLTEELKMGEGDYSHFKAVYTWDGKVVVANNTYGEPDFQGKQAGGRLAEWDGKTWTVLEKAPFVEATGRSGFGDTIFATGWDQASAILKVYTKANDTWTRYRLPKGTHTHDHMFQSEWPRIREVEHERFMMDLHGTFYELSPFAYNNRVWGIKPISRHLWVLGDFCSWRGLFVMGCDNSSPDHGANLTCGEAQSGLWFGKTDDLWNFGKPSGWGGPWWNTAVKAGEASDPYLMTGFDQKCVHISSKTSDSANITVEVDFSGTGEFHAYTTLQMDKGYAQHSFPAGFSAHWVRLMSDVDATLTAQFHYT